MSEIARRLNGLGDIPASARGVLWMLCAAACLTVMAAAVRQLSHGLHTFEIVFFRTMLGMPFMLPWLVRTRLSGLKTRRLGTLAMRGVFTMAASTCFFWSLKLVPLADATAIMFSRPLYASLLAGLVLHEAMVGRRWIAMGIGFAGVLVMLRPGFAEWSPGIALAFVASLFGAVTAIYVRLLSRTESPDTITIYYAIFMSALSVVPAMFVWQTPTGEQWIWILAMGFLGTLGQRAMSRAVASADVAVILPVDFTRLIFAAVLGFALFAELPDAWTWAGGLIIFAATFDIARQDARRRP